MMSVTVKKAGFTVRQKTLLVSQENWSAMGLKTAMTELMKTNTIAQTDFTAGLWVERRYFMFTNA